MIKFYLLRECTDDIHVRPLRVIKLAIFLLFTTFSGISSAANSENVNISTDWSLKNAFIPIKGKVTDKNGEPLPGVSVKLKGSQIGTTTNSTGEYSINMPDNGILVFSFVGFASKEVAYTKETNLNVVLQEDVSVLNEIVVTGYAPTTRKDLTGSIGIASVEDMQKAPVRSFEEALAGRVAGLQIVSQDGKPGSPLNILIRGLGSITQDSSPLYVVDGFALQDANTNSIDPNDIESISVLKDASATAIYGARGSNGVIVITTKRGQKGKPRISYAGSYGINAPTKYIPMLNAFEYIQLQNVALVSGVVAQRDYAAPFFRDGRTIEDYRNSPTIDWQDKLMKNGPQYNHSLSLSGGAGNTTYSVSGQAFGQEGIVIASDFKRYSGKVTLDQRINNNLKIGLSSSYANTVTTGRNPSSSSQSSIFYSVYGLRPVEVAGLETNFEDLLYDPELPKADLKINPIISLKNEIRNEINNYFTGTFYGEYTITNNLKFRTDASLNSRIATLENYNGSYTYSGGPNSTSGLNGSLGTIQTVQPMVRTSLNFDKTFNNHHRLNVYSAFEYSEYQYRYNVLTGTQLPDETLGIRGIELGLISPAPATRSETSSSALVSGLTQVNYNYKSRYYLTGSFRADGSSKFRPQNRWSYFPSGSVKWKMSEEPFFKKIKFISDANIRASYGLTGNNRVGDFASYQALNFNSPLTLNNVLQPNSAVVSSLDNPDLMWEKAAQTDVGLDIGFFKNKLNLTVEYYHKSISDLLFSVSLPGSSGYASSLKNIGKISNRGFEFTLTSDNISNRNFKWSSSFNITFNRNRLDALSNPNEEATTRAIGWEAAYGSNAVYIAKLGQPLGQIYGLVSEGLYQNSDFDILANGTRALKPNIPFTSTTQQPGDPKFRDMNSDGVINDNDKVVIGRGYPLHYGGLNNNFTYKRFDLNIFMQWSYGTEVVNANRIWYESGYGLQQRPGQNQFAARANAWTQENQNTDVPRFHPGVAAVYSSQYVEDGSFLRIKTLNFGYTLPEKFLQRANISRLKVYVAAQNIYTFTKYKGYDPEVSTFSSGLTPGMDWSSYPRALNITVGVNATF
jgi:TonB-linked SusC/RagA family outer membrane protein